jgi:hypothetical protein
MANTITEFNPAQAGFRVAEGPIKRKPRRASAKPQPKPQYADAVWYSFQHQHPLEVTVPVRAVEDTVRKLKRAARYLERTHSSKDKPVEVRVQIGVEPLLDDSEQPVKPAQSVVKFLGHEPWLLGRRIAKVEGEAREAGAEAAQDIIAARPKHRRTTASQRGAHARRASLRRSLVRAVITPHDPSFPVPPGRWGRGVFPEFRDILDRSFDIVASDLCPGVACSNPLQISGGV